MNGCCLDKKYGKGCTAETCMDLPVGATCSTCVHYARCCAMFGAKPANMACDFFPRRYAPRLKPPAEWIREGARADYHAVIGEPATTPNVTIRTGPHLLGSDL